jgi:hypothetical protein
LALTDVARSAGDVDQTLKVGGDVASVLELLQQALQTALSSIDQYAPPVVVEPGARAPLDVQQSAQLASLLSELMHALDADDLDRAEQLLEALTVLVLPEQLQLVRATLSDFDFRGAEAATRQMCESLEIALET